MSNLSDKGLIKKVKTAKGRKISSTKWLNRHINDRFVSMAKEEGYSSRAAFKLIEIAKKFNLFHNVNSILDIGCAPGGWLQVLREKSKAKKIIGIDLIAVAAIEGVKIIQGDFTDIAMQDIILGQRQRFDLILSDMAANACGISAADHLKIISLAESVLDFCEQAMNKNGNMVIKILHGAHEHELIKKAKNMFKNVKLYKPEASYKDSKELYLIALGFK